MRLFQKAKDGGPESPVDGYFLIEIKKLFSVVLLRFNPGTRETFHSHAFNAVTLWLRGQVTERFAGPYWEEKTWKAGQAKVTRRTDMHRIITPDTGAWALSFRGPWRDTWQEYKAGQVTTLTNGRKVVGTDTVCKCGDGFVPCTDCGAGL